MLQNKLFTQDSKDLCEMTHLSVTTRNKPSMCQSWQRDVQQVYSFKGLKLWVTL